MVAQGTGTKERAIALLDELPETALAEVVSFLEYQRYKLASADTPTPPKPRFRPTPMGGLWKGAVITSEDIAEARREMWGRYADDEQ